MFYNDEDQEYNVYPVKKGYSKKAARSSAYREFGEVPQSRPRTKKVNTQSRRSLQEELDNHYA
jgi:hypothetical protein